MREKQYLIDEKQLCRWHNEISTTPTGKEKTIILNTVLGEIDSILAGGNYIIKD